MAEAFQISCVARSLTNWGHRHITGVETAAKPGSPERWDMATVLGRLTAGDLFYTVNAMHDPVFVHPWRCWCGIRTIKTTGDDETADVLDDLPTCSWGRDEPQGATLPPFQMMAPHVMS